MTASAAEVEAAQKAIAEHGTFASACDCGWFTPTSSGWSSRVAEHVAVAVADAVVAAAQPRIAAETLREWALNACMSPVNARATFTGEQMGKTLLQRADRIEAQS